MLIKCSIEQLNFFLRVLLFVISKLTHFSLYSSAPTPAAQAPPPAAAASTPAPSVSTGDRVFASPLARKLAREAGVDLEALRTGEFVVKWGHFCFAGVDVAVIDRVEMKTLFAVLL